MNIKDMNKKPSASELRGNLVERFNLDVALENYSFNELVEMRQTLVTKINRLIESNNYDYTHTDQYQKNRLFVEILEAEIEARRPIVEGEEMKAQLVVGVGQVIDDVKNWMQKANDLKADEVLDYIEIVRDEMGADTSQQFGEIINSALENLYTAMEAAHGEMLRAQDVIMGKDPGAGDPMGAPEAPVMDEPAPEAPGDEETGLEFDDDFGATAPAAGGDEPADRTRRESIERSRRLGAIMSEGYGKKKKKTKKVAEQNRVHGDLEIYSDGDVEEIHTLPPKERLAALKKHFADPNSEPLELYADGHEDYTQDAGSKYPYKTDYSYEGDWGSGNTSMKVPARLAPGAQQDPNTGKWTRPTFISKVQPDKMTDKPYDMKFKNAGRGSEKSGHDATRRWKKEIERRRRAKK